MNENAIEWPDERQPSGDVKDTHVLQSRQPTKVTCPLFFAQHFVLVTAESPSWNLIASKRETYVPKLESTVNFCEPNKDHIFTTLTRNRYFDK